MKRVFEIGYCDKDDPDDASRDHCVPESFIIVLVTTTTVAAILRLLDEKEFLFVFSIFLLVYGYPLGYQGCIAVVAGGFYHQQQMPKFSTPSGK